VRAGIARIGKENRLRRSRDTGDVQHTNPRANPVNHGAVLKEKKIHQIPVNTSKRKRGDGEDETEQPSKKRPASGDSRVEETAAATTALSHKSQPKINTDEIRKRTEELRRKRLEAANTKNRIKGAAASTPVSPQPDHSSNSGPQKKVDEMRKKHKQRIANIKSHTATATTTTQQQEVLPSPPSSTGASPDASPSIKSQRDFTEELKQAKTRRISAKTLLTSDNELVLEAAPLSSSDLTPPKPLTLPGIETSPIPIFGKPEATFALASTNSIKKYEHTFDLFDYNDSVPILFSSEIYHSDDAWDVYTSNDALMANALCMIDKGREAQEVGLSSACLPLGREGKLDHSLPTKVIDDVDLYMRHADSRVYVASEQGLLLVTSYLVLIGVPPTQPVKFNGYVPLWAKAADYERHNRRVVVRSEAKNPDDLDILHGSIVTVHRIRDDGMAFCRSVDGAMGWFPYKYTGRTDCRFIDEEQCATGSEPEKEEYPEWDGVYFDILHPELASKDDMEDFGDEPTPEEPVSRFREGSSAKVSGSEAPKLNVLNPDAPEFKTTNTNTPTPPALQPDTTSKKVQDLEARMAELRAKIKAATEAKKAAQKAAQKAAAVAATTNAQTQTHTEVQHALPACESTLTTTSANVSNASEGDSVVVPIEGSESTAAPEVEGSAGVPTVRPEPESQAEKRPEPKPKPELEPTSAFYKPRLNPWECGMEDFVDWDDGEL
jgi:hypothetical protein